jgi:dimethylargininase
MDPPVAPLLALTRGVSSGFERCELSHLARRPIDPGRARAQHAAYVELLGELGCTVVELAPEPVFPDCVFVEDMAVVVDEVAVMTRPGARSRRGELPAVEAALWPLAASRPLVRIESPGTLDGGDVLQAGERVIVGRSARTDAGGREQLRRHLESRGYTVESVDVRGCLHLKTAVTCVGAELLLVHRPWVDADQIGALPGVELLDVDPDEPFAANALRVGDVVILPAAFPKTRRRLEARGLTVAPVDVSELAKAEGGVTCCSIVFTDRRT